MASSCHSAVRKTAATFACSGLLDREVGFITVPRIKKNKLRGSGNWLCRDPTCPTQDIGNPVLAFYVSPDRRIPIDPLAVT
jgi:hypothetical protein